jgi:hypothetical protein
VSIKKQKKREIAKKRQAQEQNANYINNIRLTLPPEKGDKLMRPMGDTRSDWQRSTPRSSGKRKVNLALNFGIGCILGAAPPKQKRINKK